jgi:hypothetical protein
LKIKKVLFLKKKNFLSRTAKIDPKDGISRLNFLEGFGFIFRIYFESFENQIKHVTSQIGCLFLIAFIGIKNMIIFSAFKI